MNHERFKSTIGFTDLLFNILVGFAFLFIVAFLLIKPEAKKKDFDRRAEFVVVLEWDQGAKDDIDLYVEDPLGGITSFRHPRVNFSHLDKDDLGSRNDTTTLPNGTIRTISINREVISIRGIIPGEWIVNAHYYSSYGAANANGDSIIIYNKEKKDYSLNVKVELHRVNPYEILGIWEKKFVKKGQEETFVRFTLNNDGVLIGPFEFEKKKYITPTGQIGAGVMQSQGATTAAAFEDYEEERGADPHDLRGIGGP